MACRGEDVTMPAAMRNPGASVVASAKLKRGGTGPLPHPASHRHHVWEAGWGSGLVPPSGVSRT